MGARIRTTIIATITTTILLTSGLAQAASTPPVKEVETARFGWEVDKTTKGNICTVASKDECQRGQPSEEPDGFIRSVNLAGAPNGNIYVTDAGNARIDELEPDGKFVLMFGRKVNVGGNDLCTATETSNCRAGETGTGPGEFMETSTGISVDQASGDVYVAESSVELGYVDRVQEFTPSGQFVLEIGSKVNSKGSNLCTITELASCIAPKPAALPESGAFDFENGVHGILVVGGPEDLLYVGDEHRVQEFDAKAGATNGDYVREISLSSISNEPRAQVQSLAVGSNGHVYVEYPAGTESIREFESDGTPLGSFATGFVHGIAVDPSGRLAVSESFEGVPRGSLYEEVESQPGQRELHLVTRFGGHGTESFSFGPNGTMFAAFGSPSSAHPELGEEVVSYVPMHVGGLEVGAAMCAAGPDKGTDATVRCNVPGSVDPWGVPGTEVWVQWGLTPLFGAQTSKQSVGTIKNEGEEETPVPVSGSLEGARPNERLYYRLAGEDAHVTAPEEPLSSLTREVTTESVPPRVVGEQVAAFQTPTSLDFFGSINPENTTTSYGFQYAPEADCDQSKLAEGKPLGEACTNVGQSATSESAEYGPIGVALEATGLAPATVYRYRMFATNEVGQQALNEAGGAQIPEATFETLPAPAVSALTEGYEDLTATSATIRGSVNPDGEMSTYTFELGVDKGAATQFVPVLTASAGSSTTPESHSVVLTGLQPGTTYAYRIAGQFGDGTAPGSLAIGEARTFTTLGLPATLSSPAALPLLALPPIQFPKATPAVAKCKKGYTRDKRGKCVKTKPKKKKSHKTRKSSNRRHRARGRH